LFNCWQQKIKLVLSKCKKKPREGLKHSDAMDYADASTNYRIW